MFVIATLAGYVPAAQAQQRTIRDELPAASQRDWDDAKELYGAGNFQDARIRFQQVYDDTNNPRVLFNVAICWKDQEHYWKALEVWNKQLELKSKLSARDVTRVEGAIAVVEPFVSTVEVQVNEPGAKLYFDGVLAGTSPFIGPLRIDVGKPEVRLEKEGFAPEKKTIDVLRATPAKVSFDLIKEGRPTKVTVNIEGPSKATIFMDGVEMGPAPFTGEVAEGRHTFEARSPGYETAQQTSEVVYGAPFALSLRLVEAKDEGKVKIVTGFEDAIIEIDGKVVGSGAWEGVLPAGGHQLVVRKDGYEDYSADLALSAEQERKIRVEMVAESSSAWIYWLVTGVAVSAGIGVGSYFVFRPSETSQVTGTLDPGLVSTSFSF